MKKASLFLVYLCLSTGLFAQNLYMRGDLKASMQSELLNKAFSNYQLYQIDAAALTEAVAKQGETFELSIDLGASDALQFDLTNSHVVSDNYATYYGTGKNARISYEKPEVYTYRGRDKNGTDEHDNAAFTFSKHGIYGTFEEAGEVYVLEPAHFLAKDIPAGYAVLYNIEDIIDKGPMGCGLLEHKDGEHEHQTESETPGGGGGGVCQRFEYEIAIANDFAMFTKYGSASAVAANNIALVNASNLNWDWEFNRWMVFTVKAQLIPVTLADDPFTTSTSINTILPNVRTLFTTMVIFPGLDPDVVHFRSPRAFGGGEVGATFLGGACAPTGKFAIFSETSVATSLPFQRMRITISHETGHQFNAGHVSQSPVTIMSSPIAIGATTNTWATASLNQINPFLSATDCLSPIVCSQSAPSTPPPGFPTSLTVGVTSCYTFSFEQSQCFNGFEIVGTHPCLQVSTTGSSMCLTSTCEFDFASLQFYLLDACLNRTSKLPTTYTITSQNFGGNIIDRNFSTGSPITLLASNDWLRITDDQEREKTIDLFDLAGRLVQHIQTADQVHEINFNTLPQGIYVARVSVGSDIFHQKLFHY